MPRRASAANCLAAGILAAVLSLTVACTCGEPAPTGLPATDVPASPATAAPLAPATPRPTATSQPAPTLPPAPSTSTTPAPGAAAPSMVDPRDGGLAVGMGEWAITLESRTIRPGPVTFTIRNSGARFHGFRIETEGSGGGDRFRVRTERIPSGGETTLTVDLPAGVYRVDCYFEDDAGDHEALGMRAQLTVASNAPLVAATPAPAPGGLAPAPAARAPVKIEGFAFVPSSLEVAAGATVEWTSQDPAPHTVTAEDGSFDSAILGTGATFPRAFPAPGTVLYRCNLHPAMRGQIVVK